MQVSNPSVLVVGAWHASCAENDAGDGLVDIADLVALLAAYGSVSPPSDVDNSGRVDFADLNLLLAGYGRACP